MSELTIERKVKILPEVKSKKSFIIIGPDSKLILKDAKFIASNYSTAILSDSAYADMQLSYQFLRTCIAERLPVYGVNTQFGDQVKIVDTAIKNSDYALYHQSIAARQENIIRSLACGLGDIVAPEIVRVTMLLRARCLAQGFSGVNPNVVEAILAFLNAGITPIVRCYGSIGASGDLIPLSMIAAAIIGENVDVYYQGNIIKAPIALAQAGLKKYQPEFREGLALINGTSFMTAVASLALYDLKRLFKQMLSAIGMALEAMLVIDSAYHPLVHQLKHHSGQINIADFLLQFWEGSQLVSDLNNLRAKQGNTETIEEYSDVTKPMQDYYSLRAVAQGFGPLQENLENATVWIENEMNSVNDNPIVDVKNGKIHQGANFMGYYITDACDILKMNIAQASTWLHALLANLVHPRKNYNLPVNLVENPSQNNGFRSMQILAAALAVQNRKLAQAQQAFMLPTEGDNQDVNSLGTHAALDLREAVANLERLTAITLLAAAQALELRGIEKASWKAQTISQQVREIFPALSNDYPMSDELNKLVNFFQQEKI